METHTHTHQVFGILIGHLYFFLNDVLPLQHGRRYLYTPWFLYSIFPPHLNANSPDFRGGGRGEGVGGIWREQFAGNGYRFN
jgi:hypothetical protein